MCDADVLAAFTGVRNERLGVVVVLQAIEGNIGSIVGENDGFRLLRDQFHILEADSVGVGEF